MSPNDKQTSIAYLVGARPNFVKVAPLVSEMRRLAPGLRHVVIHTGQHYDLEMSSIFLEELDIGSPDYELGVGSGTHGRQTALALERVEAILEELRPSALVVPGDVNSTLAGALAAVKLEIPVAHLEAGLRSFDRSMPEEINRILTDQISSWCFTHSPEAAGNLEREGIVSERIFFVGNTMIDTLVKMQARVRHSTILERLGLAPATYILVTLHRPALVDGTHLHDVIEGLSRLAEWAPIVFPIHPRTRRSLPSTDVGPNLHLISPVGYIDFLALQTDARAVITDSGGVQEETSYLGVPCFTMRENTERPITITMGTNRLIGTDADALAEIPALVLQQEPRSAPPELAGWDGRAAGRAASILLEAHTSAKL